MPPLTAPYQERLGVSALYILTAKRDQAMCYKQNGHAFFIGTPVTYSWLIKHKTPTTDQTGTLQKSCSLDFLGWANIWYLSTGYGQFLNTRSVAGIVILV